MRKDRTGIYVAIGIMLLIIVIAGFVKLSFSNDINFSKMDDKQKQDIMGVNDNTDTSTVDGTEVKTTVVEDTYEDQYSITQDDDNSLNENFVIKKNSDEEIENESLDQEDVQSSDIEEQSNEDTTDFYVNDSVDSVDGLEN